MREAIRSAGNHIVDTAMLFIGRALSENRVAGWVIGLIIVSISLYIRSTMYIGTDPAFYYYAAQQLLEGKRYYYDFFDPNFPLNYYIFTIPVLLAGITGLSSVASLTLFCTVLALASILFSGSILKRSAIYQNQLLYNFLIISFFWGHFFAWETFPTNEIGTKTVLFLGFILPYFCLMLCRAEGNKIPLSLAIFVGVLAGLATCLKPSYLLFPLVMELCLLFKKRRLMYGFRAENYAILTVNILHYSWLFFFVPEYLYHIFPMAMISYNGFSKDIVHTVFEVLLLPKLPAFIIIIIFLKRSPALMYNSFFVAAIIATLIVKGLEGDLPGDQASIPAFFIGVLLVKVMVDMVQKTVTFNVIQTAILSSMGMLMLVAVSLNFVPAQERRLGSLKQMIELTKTLAEKPEPVMVLGLPMYAYPLITYTGNPYYYKVVALTYLQQVEDNIQHDKGANPATSALMQETKAYFITAIVDGLTRHPPKILFIDNDTINLSDRCMEGWMAFLSRYSAVRNALSQYDFYQRIVVANAHQKMHADISVFIRRDR